MRPIVGAALFLAAIIPAGNPVLAEESAAMRIDMVQLPGGDQVRVVRGPAMGRQAEAPAPTAPRSELAIAAAGGILWRLDDNRLKACWVQKTSYVNGYRIRCLDY